MLTRVRLINFMYVPNDLNAPCTVPDDLGFCLHLNQVSMLQVDQGWY